MGIKALKNWFSVKKKSSKSKATRESNTENEHLAKDRVNHISVRNHVQLYGVLRSVTYPAEGSTDSFSATLFDGTGSIDLIWLGRKSVPGIIPGTHLLISGVVVDFQGALSVLNPDYQIVPES